MPAILVPRRPRRGVRRSEPLLAGLDFSPLEDWRLQLPECRRRAVRVWLWTIAAFTLLVLVIGGVTRLTHSGLSMVDWQPLIGVVPPLNEAQWEATFDRYRQFPEFQQLRRNMTLPEFKFIFFWEYLHRMAARSIGLILAVPFAIFWLRGYLNRPLALRLLALFALGAMQGLMGWLMVKSGLVDRPSVSHYRLAAHLTLAFVIFGYAIWLARDLAARPVRVTMERQVRRVLGWGLAASGALLAAQIVWGAFVAGLKAGLIFNTFPLMDGRVVPAHLFVLDGSTLAFLQNPVAVQWTHRLVGTVLLAFAGVFFVLVRRARPDSLSRRLNVAFAGLVAAQYALGVLTLLYVVPISLAVPHQALAMAIAGVWTAWVHHVRAAGVTPGSGRSAPPI